MSRLAPFYRDKIGMEAMEISDDFAYLKFRDSGGPGIAIVSRPGFEEDVKEGKGETENVRDNKFYPASFLKNADMEIKGLLKKQIDFITEPASRPNGQKLPLSEIRGETFWEISRFKD